MVNQIGESLETSECLSKSVYHQNEPKTGTVKPKNMNCTAKFCVISKRSKYK